MTMENENSLDTTSEYFRQLGQVTHELDRAEIARLWAQAKKGNKKAQHKLLEMNLRLVIPAAKRFLRPGMELMDLVEEGNLGLLQAIQKFEPAKGYRFSTYAVYWIEQYIRKYIEEQTGSIKIPSHAWGNLKRWFRAWNELKEANGRDPSLREMAQELDLSARQVKSIVDTINAARGVDSLATTVHEEEELTLEDLISDDGKGNPHDVFLQREDQNNLKQSMASLSDRDRQIIILRYGLDDNAPKTLGEVAEELGLSRERVRQIESRAIAALRREAYRAGIIEHTEENFRTRNLHTAMRPKAKTNILGEQVRSRNGLLRLLNQAVSAAPKRNTPKSKSTKKVKKNQPKSSAGKIVRTSKKAVKHPAKSVKKKAVRTPKKTVKKALKKSVVKKALKNKTAKKTSRKTARKK